MIALWGISLRAQRLLPTNYTIALHHYNYIYTIHYKTIPPTIPHPYPTRIGLFCFPLYFAVRFHHRRGKGREGRGGAGYLSTDNTPSYSLIRYLAILF
jgi:hypothetical protein